MTNFAGVSNISSSPQKTMLIILNNSLISINFHLGLKLEVEDDMRSLVNTGATVNTGNKDYHVSVIS